MLGKFGNRRDESGYLGNGVHATQPAIAKQVFVISEQVKSMGTSQATLDTFTKSVPAAAARAAQSPASEKQRLGLPSTLLPLLQ